MKTCNLLIISAVTVLATVNLLAADVALSPRASDHQSRIISGTSNDPNLAAANTVPASPRFLDNQTRTVAGKDATVAPSCSRDMNGSPKEIGVCAEHPGAAMPCCSGGATK